VEADAPTAEQLDALFAWTDALRAYSARAWLLCGTKADAP
jgi:hypothetical protein